MKYELMRGKLPEHGGYRTIFLEAGEDDPVGQAEELEQKIREEILRDEGQADELDLAIIGEVPGAAALGEAMEGISVLFTKGSVRLWMPAVKITSKAERLLKRLSLNLQKFRESMREETSPAESAPARPRASARKEPKKRGKTSGRKQTTPPFLHFQTAFPDLSKKEEEVPDFFREEAPAPDAYEASDASADWEDLILGQALPTDASLPEDEEVTGSEKVPEEEHNSFRPYTLHHDAVPGEPVHYSMAVPDGGRKKKKRTLEETISQVHETFQERLFRLIDEHGLNEVEVYRKAGIDRRHFSKIRSHRDYQPRKETALALAIAMELCLDDTKDLLGRAGYALSPAIPSDAIVAYFIDSEVYDLYTINTALVGHDQKAIGVSA